MPSTMDGRIIDGPRADLARYTAFQLQTKWLLNLQHLLGLAMYRLISREECIQYTTAQYGKVRQYLKR